MLVLQVFRWLLLTADLYLAAPILYLCLLSLSAILATHRRKKNASTWDVGEIVGAGVGLSEVGFGERGKASDSCVGTGGCGVADAGALCLSWWESAPVPQDEDKHKAPASATPHPLVPTPYPKYLPLKAGVGLGGDATPHPTGDASVPAPHLLHSRPYEMSAIPRFAILVPAHNEESILGTLLQSLSQLDYPIDAYTICVVADNCTDGTAALARATGGVRVYERFDQTLRGKGYALNWLMGQLEAEQIVYDAYVILDADSVVEPTFLRSMARELAQGARAMQANNTVLNVTASPSTALRLIAMTLVNHVRPLGRNGLGASSTLTGNGMCLSRALLLRYPWQAFSLAEDYQYYLSLVEQGERVRYVPEAIARSEMPTTFSQMRTQDIRWESADGSQATGKVALKLLQAGLRNHDFVRIEAIAELLTPPLSLLLCGSLLLALTALFTASWFALGVSLFLLLGLLGYIGSALYLLRPPRAVYEALLHAPRFILWKLWVYFVLSRSNKHKGMWVRTSRS